MKEWLSNICKMPEIQNGFGCQQIDTRFTWFLPPQCNASHFGQQQNGSKLSLSLLIVAGNPTMSIHFSIPASAPECVPLPCEAPHKVGVSFIFINLHNTAARPHLYRLKKSIVSSHSQSLSVPVPAHPPDLPVEELPGEERLGQRCLGIK